MEHFTLGLIIGSLMTLVVLYLTYSNKSEYVEESILDLKKEEYVVEKPELPEDKEFLPYGFDDRELCK